MGRAKSGRTARLVAVAVTLAMIAAACGSGAEGGDEGDGGASVSESAASDAGESPGPETDPVAAAGPQAEQPEGQAAAESPAAEADAERQPAVWTEAVIGTVDISPGRSGLWTVDDEIWFTTGRWNSSFVARSSDRGMTFDEVIVERPPAAGLAYQSSTVDGLVSDGFTIVGWGRRGRRCTVVAMDGPFDDVVSCSRQGAVIHRSTDGGVTWEQFEPPVMALGDSNVVLAGVVAVEGGFVAAGTVQGTDWHGRVWVSPDGESWTLARELRGVGAAMSIYGIASDGETLVVEAAEHVCVAGGIQGGSNLVSWSLGTGFASDVRLFIGTAAEALELVDEGDVPFVLAPREVDCASTSPFSLAQEPYPNVSVATVDGRIVVVDTSAFPDVESTDDGPALSSRRWATLAGGEWQEVSIPDVIRPVTNALDYRSARFLLPDETGMGLYEAAREGRNTGLRRPRPVRLVDGEYEQVELPVVAAWRDLTATSVDGALLVVSLVVADPFLRSRVSNDPAEVVVFRYDDPPAQASCDPVAGGSCRFARLDLVAGYPDFAGRDLAGIDLSWADLGEANFDGAVLDGADLRTAELGDVGGADFTDADLAGAELRAATQPILDGAVLTNLDLLSSRGDDDSAPLELSLGGLDLSGVSIDRPRDGRPIIIIDLTGAIVDDRTWFSGVDMTDTVLGGVDITVPSVLDDSICPGGLAPVGGYIGNCPPPR